MAVRDLAGQRFGRLTVLERAGSTPGNRRALWRCRCACGTEILVPSPYLATGDTRSCGCLHRDRTAAKGRAKLLDLSGQSFGRLTVRCLSAQARTTKGEALWLCDCTCGGTINVSGSRLRRGSVLSCGCLRDELLRARARAVGSAKRINACRTCGRIYEAAGPQKECSRTCRNRYHARNEALRRRELAQIRAAKELAALQRELEGL